MNPGDTLLEPELQAYLLQLKAYRPAPDLAGFRHRDRMIELTPEVYARMRGPYNRRNVYGAALSYAPVIPPELRDPVLRHALCGEAPLLRELGIELADQRAPVVVVLEPLPGTTMGNLATRFPVSCDRETSPSPPRPDP
jgi:hypothetical protein